MLTLSYTSLLLFAAFGFVLGYIAGRVDLLVARGLGRETGGGLALESRAAPANTLRAAMREAAPAKIEIDTGKYVGEINTNTLQKTQQLELGKTTQTQDDINSSVSKLAQLKGK